MRTIRNFLWFCAGADTSILKKCPSDANKYMGIGGTVLFTAILAFFSGAYALYTVFGNAWMAAAFGLVWSLMIFNLDRYIVSSMKAQGSFWKDFRIAIPRLIIAILIAFVISKPLELKIFDKEIHSELIIMEQEIYAEQEQKIKERYLPQLISRQDQIEVWKEEISEKETIRNELAMIAQKEADGTGGSMQKNLGPIYKSKKADADKAQRELEQVLAANQPLIDANLTTMAEINQKVEAEIAAIDRLPFDGFAARVEALSRLTKESNAMDMAHIFIMLLFITIETAPIFVKLISSRSPYDYMLHKHEHTFQMYHQERTTSLANETANKIRFDTETGVYRNNVAIEAEKDFIDQEVKDQLAVKKAKSFNWKESLVKGFK